MEDIATTPVNEADVTERLGVLSHEGKRNKLLPFEKRNAGLKLKPSKCHFAQTSVKFFGFQIGDTGLTPYPEKVKTIKEYPVPKDLTELRRFIGMISYYRRFILRFSDVASPLHRLLQKDVKFEWNNNCQDSFEDLKDQLISSPILGFPDTNKDYVLYTDASDVGIGAVLTQKDKDGADKVISFASKAFSSAEKNWTTTEKEAFAVVWALQYFHPYVYGRHVLVFTDHRALQWIKGMKHPNGKLARWILKLEEYDYAVEHRPGTTTQLAFDTHKSILSFTMTGIFFKPATAIGSATRFVSTTTTALDVPANTGRQLCPRSPRTAPLTLLCLAVGV
eukprot:gene10577-11699_t